MMNGLKCGVQKYRSGFQWVFLGVYVCQILHKGTVHYVVSHTFGCSSNLYEDKTYSCTI